MRRQGQLHKDAVNSNVRIELLYEVEKYTLRCVCSQPVLKRPHSRFKSLARFGSDIDLARGIFPHKHDRESGHDTPQCEYGNLICQFVSEADGGTLAVNDSHHYNESWSRLALTSID